MSSSRCLQPSVLSCNVERVSPVNDDDDGDGDEDEERVTVVVVFVASCRSPHGLKRYRPAVSPVRSERARPELGEQAICAPSPSHEGKRGGGDRW